jgi:hypothetical protein
MQLRSPGTRWGCFVESENGMIKTIAITDFLPPLTDWGQAPVMPMALGADCTCLAACADGQLLAVLHLPAHNLVTGIRQDTLFTRIASLKQRSPWAYLLVSGQMEPMKNGMTRVDGADTKWAWSAVQGALATVQELGVVVVLIPDEGDVGPAVERLAKRDRGAKRLAPAREIEIFSPAEAILLALPGIGEKHMLQILGFVGGSAADALMALTAADVDIPGIGPKTRQAVREALGLKPDEMIVHMHVTDTITPAAQAQKAA